MSPAQKECIQLCEDMLKNAQNGEITSMVVVACGPVDFGTAMAGSDAARMNLGLDIAKQVILERATAPGPRNVLR